MRAFQRLAVALLTTMAAVPSVVVGQVSCADPDNLCTGDPCVIGSVTVESPCIVDFTPRAVVIAGQLKVPSDGTLSLTAATIQLDGSVAANHTGLGDGGDVAFTATTDVFLNGLINTVGYYSSGSLSVTAGGSVVMGGPIKTSAIYAAGGVSVDAGGVVTVAGPLLAKGGSFADGGDVHVSGDAGVTVAGTVKTSAGRGSNSNTGGDVVIESSGGFVTMPGKIVTRGVASGSVSVTAAGNIDMSGVIKTDDSASRLDPGAAGYVTFTSTAGDVALHGTITARGIFVAELVVEAANQALIDGRLKITGRSDFGDGGTIDVSAASVVIQLPAKLNTTSPSYGGFIRLTGTDVNVLPGSLLDARGTEDGGGAIRIRAVGGNAALGGSFSADGGDDQGVIEASASGDLTADGSFRCSPGGCIAFSAGGTLDTSAGSFDVPVVADCPGSPSGAFVDGP